MRKWLFLALLGVIIPLAACATGPKATPTPTLSPGKQVKVNAVREAGIDLSRPVFIFLYADG